MVKLFVEKNEDAASVIERILEEKDQEIILVIPKNSRLKESIENFSLIQREAAAARKTVNIESVDEEILAFGRMHKMEGAHPLFSGKSRSLSDIVPSEGSAPAGRKGKGKKVSLKISSEKEEEELEDKKERRRTEHVSLQVPKEEEAEEKYFETPAEYPEEEAPVRKNGGRKVLVAASAALAVVVVGIAGWSIFGARAQVVVNFKRTSWEYQAAFTADKSAGQANAATRTIPAELFSDQKNITQLFPATGKANVNQKATGQITIYNAYSSAKQTLVATTRFMTPDGKIFRLDNQVVVPGATVKNGQITPASIKTNITADKAGPDYNVGPMDKLTIPGFKGGPKYDKFWGALESPASGGFIGERAVPTDADMNSAKDKVANMLKASFADPLLAGDFKDFKILDGASAINISKLTVKKETNENGQFSVFGEANYQAIGFRESDLRNVLLEIANKDNPGTSFRDLELSYGNIQPNYALGRLSFGTTAKGDLAAAFQPEELKSRIAGQSLDSVRGMIAQLPGLADAKVSLWPLWLKTLPSSQSRIEVKSN